MKIPRVILFAERLVILNPLDLAADARISFLKELYLEDYDNRGNKDNGNKGNKDNDNKGNKENIGKGNKDNCHKENGTKDNLLPQEAPFERRCRYRQASSRQYMTPKSEKCSSANGPWSHF